MEYGIIALIPVVFVFVIAITTKKTLDSLLIGSLIGFIILAKQNFIGAWLDSLIEVLKTDSVLWVILVTLFFGILLQLIEQSGSLSGFSKTIGRYAKTKRSAMLLLWVSSLAIFIDDYLHNLVIGASMKKVGDEHKISRAKIAYLTNSTAGTFSSLIPISTWAVFYSGLIASQNLSVDGNAMAGYIKTIPFQFYPMIAITVSLLVALRIMPDIGPMKKHEANAEKGVFSDTDIQQADDKGASSPVWFFIIPVAVLIAVTIITGIDVLKGIVGALIAAIILYSVTKKLNIKDFMDIALEGMKNMLPIACILAIAFVLVDANTKLGLAEYIIDLVRPFMSGKMLPLVVFLTATAFAYFTGMFWDMAAVMLPIAVPLATQIGANPYLVSAAIFSASAWGSQICMYGDAVIVNSGACEISPAETSFSSLPYGIIGVIVSAILYTIFGFIV
ncbi:Na+/H+ antiporter NhaC family protein [Treponema socranskii]|uniref:Na+/H+ antiporter NhaC family protein n=1 Tax=Treponema socranskii TaxID=53419 RepID=UPI003D701AE6